MSVQELKEFGQTFRDQHGAVAAWKSTGTDYSTGYSVMPGDTAKTP